LEKTRVRNETEVEGFQGKTSTGNLKEKSRKRKSKENQKEAKPARTKTSQKLQLSYLS
jgi:hypothetical protein